MANTIARGPDSSLRTTRRDTSEKNSTPPGCSILQRCAFAIHSRAPKLWNALYAIRTWGGVGSWLNVPGRAFSCLGALLAGLFTLWHPKLGLPLLIVSVACLVAKRPSAPSGNDNTSAVPETRGSAAHHHAEDNDAILLDDLRVDGSRNSE